LGVFPRESLDFIAPQEAAPMVEVANVFETRALLDLPEGIGWAWDEQSHMSGTDRMYAEIKSISESYPKIDFVNSGRILNREQFAQKYANEIGLNGGYIEYITKVLLERYPNLQLMRGGSLRVQNGVAVLEGGSSGTDFLLGSVGAVNYAYRDHDGNSRKGPVMYCVPWSTVIRDRRLFMIGSHTGYDFGLTPRDHSEEYYDWCRENLKVIRLPDDPARLPDIKNVLRSKSIQ